MQESPKYKFVLMANRDEFYQRPTQTAQWWTDHPEIVGGKDLKANGTWLGMTRKGKFAAITNYRDLKNLKSDAPTRGKLVAEFLENDIPPEAFLKDLENTGHQYNGFNLLFGSVDKLYYYSNYAKSSDIIEKGTFGLSNALLDDAWPKVTEGKARLNELLKNDNEFNTEMAILQLANKHKAPDHLLPDTGVGLELERTLSPLYIESPGYGTRCSTVITVDHDNLVRFTEVSYLPENRFDTQFAI